jgi:hypothetical protein
MKIYSLLLVLLLFSSCITASLSTGTATESKIKSENTTGQASSTVDNSNIVVGETSVEVIYNNTIVRVKTPRAEANTGSRTTEDVRTQQVLEAVAKGSSNAVSQATGSLNLVLIICIVLAIFTVGSRTIWPLLKKYYLGR